MLNHFVIGSQPIGFYSHLIFINETNIPCSFVQVKQIYKGYGSIRKKPEINGIPLKRAPIETDKGTDAVMDTMLVEDSKVWIDGKEVEWWKAPGIHWYIIRGQYTVIACRELARDFRDDYETRKDLLEFEVIPVFSREPEVLIQLSNTFNLNIIEKVAKENFRSCAELGRLAWKKAGSLEPHRGGGKPSSLFMESSCLLLYRLAADIICLIYFHHPVGVKNLIFFLSFIVCFYCIGCQPIRLGNFLLCIHKFFHLYRLRKLLWWPTLSRRRSRVSFHSSSPITRFGSVGLRCSTHGRPGSLSRKTVVSPA